MIGQNNYHNRKWFPEQMGEPLDQLAQMVCFGFCTLEAGQIAELPQPETEDSTLLVGVEQGCLSAICEQNAFCLHAGHLIAVCRNQRFLFTTERTTTIHYALIAGQAGALLRTTISSERCFFYGGQNIFDRILTPLIQEAESGAEPEPAVAARAAYELLLQFYGKAKEVVEAAIYPPLVSDALQILREDFIYLQGIEELARRLMVSEAHLVRSFRTAIGMTPGRYLTALRINYAKALLREPNLTVEAVALASGFSSASYFCKVFRSIVHMTPAQYSEKMPKNAKTADDRIYL